MWIRLSKISTLPYCVLATAEQGVSSTGFLMCPIFVLSAATASPDMAATLALAESSKAARRSSGSALWGVRKIYCLTISHAQD